MRFEELEVWKRSAKLSAEIYKELRNLKDFGFKDQITRSGLSISSNVAEGFERDSDKQYLNFLSYAKGSCGELRSQIYIGMDIGYIDKKITNNWIKEAVEISSMLSGFMKAKRNFLKNDAKKGKKNKAKEDKSFTLEPLTFVLSPLTCI